MGSADTRLFKRRKRKIRFLLIEVVLHIEHKYTFFVTTQVLKLNDYRPARVDPAEAGET
jgi:hypothetical protein